MNKDYILKLINSIIAGGAKGINFLSGAPKKTENYSTEVVQQANQQVQASQPTATPYPRGYAQGLLDKGNQAVEQERQDNQFSFTSAAGNQYTMPKNPEYDKTDVKSLVQKYFPADQVENALKVIQAESGGQWWKVGDDYPIKGQTIPSYGLMQVRSFPGRPDKEKLMNPEENVKYGAEIYKRHGWQPWTTAQEMGLK